MKKLNKKSFHNKILISTKLPNPILETRVSKLVFTIIPYLKFWALCAVPSTHSVSLLYSLFLVLCILCAVAYILYYFVPLIGHFVLLEPTLYL